jgi:hypothetical protein
VLAKSTPDDAITKEVVQESCCCFGSTGGRTILLKPAISFIIFQRSKAISKKKKKVDNFQQ